MAERIGRKVIKDGKVKLIEEYFKGWHSELGTLKIGWSGKETVATKTVVKPISSFTVLAKEES